MKTLSRNKNNDIYIQAGGLAMSTGAEAKCDIIESLILTQQGELQFDADAGIDYFGTVFQHQEYLELWASQVRTKVLDIDWVAAVDDFTYRYDVVTSSVIWSMTVTTTDGETLNPSSKKKKSDDVMKYEVKWDTIYNKEHVDEAISSMQGMSKASNSKYQDGLSSSASLMDTKKAINDILLTPNGAPDTDDSDDIRFVLDIARGNTVVKTGKVSASGEWSIDWGDGVRESYEGNADIDPHTYANEGSYLIVLAGSITAINAGAENTNAFLYTESASASVSITGFSAGRYSSLSELGDYSFYGCSALNAVVVSSPLATIGANAFSGTGISTLDWMPQTVTAIGNGCFKNCFYLRSIKGLSKSITDIPQESFMGCSNVESLVYIPQGITAIGASAFEGCSKAKDALIPASCASIGNSAFKNCADLVNIRSDKQVAPTFGSDVFLGIKTGADLYIPNGGNYSAWNWNQDHTKEFGRINFTTNNIVSGTKVFSARGAFKSACAMLVEYGDGSYAVLRNTETTIPEHEYSQSNNSIVISGYVTEISGIDNKSFPCLAFDKLRNGDYITGVNADSMTSLTTVGDYAFFTCTNLQTASLPASVATIGSYAFADTSSLNSITANGVTTLGAHCFESCGLSAIPSFVSTMTSLPAYCFAYCGGIEAFANVANIVSFGAYCFTETGLTSLAGIGAGLTSLGVGCFAKCVALENISALSTCAVTGLSDDCFNGCNNASFTSLNGTQNITAVGARCFQGTNIQTLQYLNAVETIGDEAFRDTQLSGTDYLPSSLTSLGNYCFANTVITEVNFYVENPPSITENTFGFVGIAESLPIYVLPDSLEAYQSEPIWNGLGVKTRGVKITIGEGGFQAVRMKDVIAGEGLRYVSFNGGVSIANFTNAKIYDMLQDGDEFVIAGNITGIKAQDNTRWNVKEISVASGTEITSIEANAFNGQTVLTTASLAFAEDGEIGASAFEGCTALTSLDLGGEYGPTTIGASAFEGCTPLELITGAEKVTTIGDSAFEGCSALTTLEGFPSIGSIGKNAFKDCSALNRVILTTETVPAVGEDAFSGIHSSAYLQVPAKVIAAYNGWGGFTRIYPLGIAFKMSIPEGGLSLAANTALVESAEGCVVDWGDGNTDSITSGQQLLPSHSYANEGTYYIELTGDGITKISANLVELPMFTTGERGACPYLTAFMVPPSLSLQKIGDYTFYKCTELTDVDIGGEEDLSIGQYAFAECTALSTLNVGIGGQAKISALATAAFKECTSLTELPSVEVTYIGESAFEGCRELGDADGFSGVVTIGARAFYGCDQLENMPIVGNEEETVTIGDCAFYGCEALETLDHTVSRVVSIGDYGFYGCSSLTATVLEGFTSLESVGDSAFVGCSNISSMSGLEKLQTIGNYAFQNCAAITDISHLVKLTSIGTGAFSGCGIQNLVCASGDIVSIGDLAFAGCPLKKISMSAVTPPMIGQNTFFGVDKSIIPVKVPQTGIAKYRDAKLWNEMPINYWAEFANLYSSQTIKFYLSGIPASGLAISGRTAVITVEPTEITESVYDSNTGNTITATTQYRDWTVDWGDGSRVETFDADVTSLPRHVYTGEYSSAVISISGNMTALSVVGKDESPIIAEEGEAEFPYLTKVEVDDSVPLTTIGAYCFYNSVNLAEFDYVRFDSLTIGTDAFKNTKMDEGEITDASSLASAAGVPNAQNFNDIIAAIPGITENSTPQDAINALSN